MRTMLDAIYTAQDLLEDRIESLKGSRSYGYALAEDNPAAEGDLDALAGEIASLEEDLILLRRACRVLRRAIDPSWESVCFR